MLNPLGPEIELASLWILVEFDTTEPQRELPNKVFCFVSMCVSSDNSFPSVRQEPILKPWEGSPFRQQREISSHSTLFLGTISFLYSKTSQKIGFILSLSFVCPHSLLNPLQSTCFTHRQCCNGERRKGQFYKEGWLDSKAVRLCHNHYTKLALVKVTHGLHVAKSCGQFSVSPLFAPSAPKWSLPPWNSTWPHRDTLLSLFFSSLPGFPPIFPTSTWSAHSQTHLLSTLPALVSGSQPCHPIDPF